MRTLLARDGVIVQVTESSRAPLAREEIYIDIESSHHLPVHLIRAPLGT